MISIKSILASAFALPFLASAIIITTPTNGTLATKGKDLKVSWTSVDTDPTTFGILLVNFVYWPPSYVQLAFNVPVSDGSTTVYIPCDTIATDGYQINAINGTNTYVIYSQSSKFTICGADCTDPKPPKPTCAASTVTLIASPTAKFGEIHAEVPKTIGWHGHYGNPVTLTTMPTAPPKAPVRRSFRPRLLR